MTVRRVFAGVMITAVAAVLVPSPASAGGEVVARAGFGYHWILPEDVIGIEVSAITTGSATKHADGSVHGVFTHRQSIPGESFHFVIKATCMEIYEGNRVKIGGVIEVSNDETLPAGGFAWFQAIDNGEGAGAPPDLSTFVGFGTEEENEAYCASPEGARFGPFEVTGNLEVSEE